VWLPGGDFYLEVETRPSYEGGESGFHWERGEQTGDGAGKVRESLGTLVGKGRLSEWMPGHVGRSGEGERLSGEKKKRSNDRGENMPAGKGVVGTQEKHESAWKAA